MKVIFHLSEPSRWAATLSNIPALLQQAERAGVVAHAELVINGDPVVQAQQGSEIDLSGLIAAGVTVAACGNALRQRQIDADTLQPGVIVVPSAMFELAQRQLDGYAYIKP
ncbi:DsrE family protein [Lacticaseibacillus absianus]|uniref:DsrE family protein n=1 Tax=Lacticaseibacillus absianus TaxID=2729623 RepID=UPI0015C98465|nr:DsrE family protein [Lacticaseibacillus absianus]